MRILVFGATGRVGAAVVDAALGAGHRVTAFVRDPSRVAASPARTALAVVRGDVRDAAEVRAALAAGVDAVIFAVGADVFAPSTVVSDGAGAVVEAMRAVGVARYVGVSGAAQLPSTLAGRITRAVMERSPIRHAVLDHQRAYDLVRTSGLEHTLAGCPHIPDEPARGRYHESATFPGGYHHIAPGDVADFLVRHAPLEVPARGIVGIWY